MDGYSLKMELTSDGKEYNSLIEYIDYDGKGAAVCVSGESLSEVLTAAYDEIVEELTAEKDVADMTDEEYINFLEEKVLQLKYDNQCLEKENHDYKNMWENKTVEVKTNKTKPATFEDYSTSDIIDLINKYLGL